MAFAYKDDRAVLNTTVRTEQSLVRYPINAEPATGSVIVLFAIDDKTQVVRLKLDTIQLRIELFHLFAIPCIAWFRLQPFDFRLEFPCTTIRVCDTVQLIQPSEHLTVSKGYDFIVSPRLR